MKKRFFILAVMILAAACSSRSKRPAVIDVPDEEAGNPAFEKGLKALGDERYAEAAQIFDQLTLTKTGSEADLVTLYNSGAAYEGLGQCQKAADRYRQVVRSSAGKFKQLEGPALFRLSLMYECLGQDTKTVTALLDARKRGAGLPPETLGAELPARLAAAYARLGNRQKALEYFQQASEGLKRIVAQANHRKQTELLSRTMYLMGQLNPGQRSAAVSPESYMQSIGMQQPYLLQSVEMDHPTWSRKAADDLRLAYDNIFKLAAETAESKRQLYTRGLQALQELKKIRLPNSPPEVSEVFAHLEKLEVRLQSEYQKVAEINRLTPESEKREGLKRQGRLIDPPKTPKAKK